MLAWEEAKSSILNLNAVRSSILASGEVDLRIEQVLNGDSRFYAFTGDNEGNNARSKASAPKPINTFDCRRVQYSIYS